MIQEGARQKPYDLTSGVTHHHYRNISFFVKYVSLICCVGGLPNSMNTRRGVIGNHLGICLAQLHFLRFIKGFLHWGMG